MKITTTINPDKKIHRTRITKFPRLFQLKMDDELLAKLVKQAAKEDRSVSFIIRKASHKYVDEAE